MSKRIAIAVMLILIARVACAAAPAAERLLEMSLEELTKIDVTIASRGAERLNRTAAPVSVLTGEQIRRAGVTSIPEALRLVPGVVVARITANQWAISCRHPNGRFSNKLLVLIDGRTVYSPLFSGTFWDQQDTMMEDIDRIEVIRGPGAAPWGSNAVSGVIHVITKSACETRKDYLAAAGGDEERFIGAARHGWAVKGGGARVWAKATERDSFRFVNGADAQDGWDSVRGGFRLDRTVEPGRDLTVIGNVYDSDQSTTERFVTAGFPFTFDRVIGEDASGASLTGRLQGKSAVGDWSLQAYADHNTKDEIQIASRASIFDVEYQRRLPRGRRELLFGFDYRLIEADFENGSPQARFDPDHRQTYIAAAFAQHRWTGKDDSWNVIAATRAEVNHFTGLEWQPSLRGAWFPSRRGMLWGALSRAVRVPSVSNEDITIDVSTFPPGTFGPGTPQVVNRFQGRTDTEAEVLDDAELGGRVKVGDQLYLDGVVYHGRYPNLVRSVVSSTQLVPGAVPFILNTAVPQNIGRAKAAGAELAVNWSPRRDLRFTASFAHATFRVNPDFGLLDPEGRARLPENTASFRTEWEPAPGWELDGVTYYSDSLPAFGIPSWFRTDLHLGRNFDSGVRLELVGQNLLDSNHLEFGPEQVGTPAAENIPRSWYARVSRSF